MNIFRNHLLIIASLFLISTGRAADCFSPQDKVTLSGIVTSKATFIEPGDFGWVPKNGFIKYEALVTTTPVCFQDKEEGHDVKDVYVLQLGGLKLSAAQLKNLENGIKVTLKGSLFPEHTAHHFQSLVMLVESAEFN